MIYQSSAVGVLLLLLEMLCMTMSKKSIDTWLQQLENMASNCDKQMWMYSRHLQWL